MADNSNLFSMSGLSRNKTLSGLHAHRPENSTSYFKHIELATPPQFVSILEVNIDSPGYNYSKNTTLVFPQPEHPSGVLASGYPLFTPAKSSFSITSPGSGYSLYQIFPIYYNNQNIGNFFVVATGSNGSITDHDVLCAEIDMSDSSSLPTVSLTGNNSANITSNDKFTISSIELVSPGCGYQTFNRVTGSTIYHNPTISNQGSSNPQPSGLSLKSSINPFVFKYTIEEDRLRLPTLNKFDEITPDNKKTYYSIINNFSLGDFLS